MWMDWGQPQGGQFDVPGRDLHVRAALSRRGPSGQTSRKTAARASLGLRVASGSAKVTRVSEPTRDHRPRMTLDIHGDQDWCGSLKVGFYSDHLGAFWWWEVSNGNGALLDSSEKLEMAGPQTPREAMRVLLMFLLCTREPFNDKAAEWSRTHRSALEKALAEV